MPKKARGKKKAVKKKVVKKKITKKKTVKKKASVRKKTLKKKAIKKPARKKVGSKAKSAGKTAAPAKTIDNVSRAAAMTTPSSEMSVQSEEAVGTVTHYYSHLNVAVIQLNRGKLKTGDTIHIKGTTTDFTQIVESMEYEHRPIDEALEGQSFGLRVKEHAREHDTVYLVK
ncbi:MAG TPA: hypothetical protein VLX29_00530 [Nitrospirota bacterium]|nr:hypothetical protein [Nitrospirota bacterium]